MFPSETLKHLLRSLNPRINNHRYIIMQNISEQTKVQGLNRATLGQEICTQSIVNTTATEARKSSENVTSQFSIISQLFKAIVLAECVPTFLEINWNKSFRYKQTTLEHLSSRLRCPVTAAKPVFSRRRENENDCKCPKMKSARAKRAKLLFFIVKYANLWRSCCRRPCGCFSSLISRQLWNVLMARPMKHHYVNRLRRKESSRLTFNLRIPLFSEELWSPTGKKWHKFLVVSFSCFF